MQREFQP